MIKIKSLYSSCTFPFKPTRQLKELVLFGLFVVGIFFTICLGIQDFLRFADPFVLMTFEYMCSCWLGSNNLDIFGGVDWINISNIGSQLLKTVTFSLSVLKSMTSHFGIFPLLLRLTSGPRRRLLGRQVKQSSFKRGQLLLWEGCITDWHIMHLWHLFPTLSKIMIHAECDFDYTPIGGDDQSAEHTHNIQLDTVEHRKLWLPSSMGMMWM